MAKKGIKFSPAVRAAALANLKERLRQKGVGWEDVPEGVAGAIKFCFGFAKGRLIYAPAMNPKATAKDRKAAEDLLRKVYKGKPLCVPGSKDRFSLLDGVVATRQEHFATNSRLSLGRPPKVQ